MILWFSVTADFNLSHFFSVNVFILLFYHKVILYTFYILFYEPFYYINILHFIYIGIFFPLLCIFYLILSMVFYVLFFFCLLYPLFRFLVTILFYYYYFKSFQPPIPYCSLGVHWSVSPVCFLKSHALFLQSLYSRGFDMFERCCINKDWPIDWLIICVLFVKQCLVLRDSDNELVSYC